MMDEITDADRTRNITRIYNLLVTAPHQLTGDPQVHATRIEQKIFDSSNLSKKLYEQNMEKSIRIFSMRVENASNPQNQTQPPTQTQQPLQQPIQQSYHKQQPIHPYQQPSYPKQIPTNQYPHSSIQMSNQYSNVPINGYNQMQQQLQQHHIQQQQLQQPSHIQSYQSTSYQTQHQMYQNIPPQSMQQPLHQGMHQSIQTQPQQIPRLQKPTQSNYQPQQQIHQPLISKQKLVQQPISQQIPMQQQYPQSQQPQHHQQSIYNKSRYNQPLVQKPSFQQYYPYENTGGIIEPQQNQYSVLKQQGYSNIPQYIQPNTNQRQIPPRDESYGMNLGTGKVSQSTDHFADEKINYYLKIWRDTESIATRCINSPTQNNPNFQKIVHLFRSVYSKKPTIEDLRNPDFINRLTAAYESIKKLIEANKKKEMSQSQQMNQKLSSHVMNSNIGSSGSMMAPMHDFDIKNTANVNVNMMKQQPIVIKTNDSLQHIQPQIQPQIQQQIQPQQQFHPPPSQQYIPPTQQQYHPPPQLQRQTQIPTHQQVPRQLKPTLRENEVPPMSFEVIIDNIKKMKEPEKNNALEVFLKQYKKGSFNVSNKENFERLYREIMKGENEDRFFWWNIREEDDIDSNRVISSFFRSQTYENQELDKFMGIDDFNLIESNNDPFEVFKAENPILM